MTEENIKELERLGFKRWTKGNMDRMYVNASTLGLECEYYKTGNISSATFCGERVSNCQARSMKAAKTYVDVSNGSIHSDNDTLKDKVVEIMEGLSEVVA